MWMSQQTTELAGFGRRLAAHLIDLLWMIPLSLVLGVIGDTVQGGTMSLGGEMMASLVVALIVVSFWAERQATPGKLALGLRIVDAATGGPVPVGKLLTRYVGYILSAIPLCLGYLWMLWDSRRQTWHDKMAATVVVKLVPRA
jgi:uncharacterized RDD family membrane protein YckC